ncbi:MAG: hypothetical protein AAF823_10150 [Planctomycetota bacterium]
MARWPQRIPRIGSTAVAAAAALAIYTSPPAQAQHVYGFDGFDHGETIPTAVGPLTLKALNPGGTLVAFDTGRVATGLPDLEGPGNDLAADRLWTLGNLPPETMAGVVVRAQGGSADAVDVLLTLPNAIPAVTFDLANVPDPAAVDLTFIGGRGRSARLTLADLTDPTHTLHQPGLVFGAHSHNRVGPFYAPDLGLDGVRHLRIRLPQNAGLDRVALHRSRPDAHDLQFAFLDLGGGFGTESFNALLGGSGGGIALSAGGGGGTSGSGGPGGGPPSDPPRRPGGGPPPNDPPGPDDPPLPPGPTPDDPYEQIPVPSPTGAAGAMALLAALLARRSRRSSSP